MKRLLNIFLVIISVINFGESLAQNQYIMEWSEGENSQIIPYTSDCANGNAYECQKIRLDSGNNIIVGGSSFENGNYDFLVLKYSNSGTLIWKQLIDISNESIDYLTGISIDISDNIIVTGVSKTSNNASKSVIIKLNEVGDILWESIYSDEYNWSFSQNLAIDTNGNIFITGYVNSGWNSRDMFVCKFDGDGNLLWSDIYAPDESSWYVGLTLRIVDDSVVSLGYSSDSSNNKRVIILKHSQAGNLISSNEALYEGNLSRYHIDNIGNSYIGMFGDFKIFKFNPSGSEEWEFEVPANLPNNVTADEVKDIISDEEGNIYITGRHYGEGYGTSNYTNGDLQVNKISSEGDLVYSYRYENLGANAFDAGNKLFLGNNNYIAVGGSSQNNIGDDYNYLAIVLDNLGEPIDTIRQEGQGGDSVIKSVVLDDNFNLYLTGTGNGYTLTQKYSISGTLSINEVSEIESKIRVYPNPFLNELKIITEDIPEFNEFILFNLNGKMVYRKSLENESTINFEGFTIPKGLYFYKITYGKDFQFGKLIKK